jgi:hypothetical protein
MHQGHARRRRDLIHRSEVNSRSYHIYYISDDDGGGHASRRARSNGIRRSRPAGRLAHPASSSYIETEARILLIYC